MLTAVLLAIKYHEDLYYDNAFYAAVGGVALAELNYLESQMLALLRFELFVAPAMYEKCLDEIRLNSTMSAPTPAEPEEDMQDGACDETKDPMCCRQEQGPTMGSIGTQPSNAEVNEEVAN